MFSNYLKIAWRFLTKNKLYSFVNIAGLSLGLACAILMVLYVQDELTFDRFHRDAEHIYRIGINVRNPDGSSTDKIGSTSVLQGPVFQEKVPGVESFVRIGGQYRDVQLGDQLTSQRVLKVDTNFFTFFSFELLQGNPANVLDKKNSLVITEDVAVRHFGTPNALGKEILFASDGQLVSYEITGVTRRVPQNSTIQFEMLVPLELSPQELTVSNWNDLPVNTFVRLAENSEPAVVVTRMQRVFEKEAAEAVKQIREAGFSQSFYHMLQPLLAVHLGQDFPNDTEPANRSKPVYSYVLSGIALFILAIACVNFINHTMARSVRRAKEIGIRKVVGGNRRQLLYQFLGESFLLTTVSFLGALLLTQLILPAFNDAVNKQLSLAYLIDVQLVFYFVLLFLITGLLAGFYPALVLSGYRPAQVLYQQFRVAGQSVLQKGLIVFQFVLATVMILATVIIYQQFDYLVTRDPGYDASNVIRVAKRNLTISEARSFSAELLRDASVTEAVPHGQYTQNGKVGSDTIQNFMYELVDENYLNMLKITVVLGRPFDGSPNDSARAAIVNETFVTAMGWLNPIGKEIDLMPFDGVKRVVVGVVRDHHFESLKQKINPQLFIPTTQTDEFVSLYEEMLVRFEPTSRTAAINHIERTFKRLFPMNPMSVRFYQDTTLEHYRLEGNWRRVILISAALTFFIAGIGLFGLSVLEAERRFKEVGIRKVLGASVNAIVMLLFRDLLLLISLALLIAIPIAWYGGNEWLSAYPYRTELSVGIFVFIGLVVVAIGLGTISYQSLRTARMNPVDAIRRD